MSTVARRESRTGITGAATWEVRYGRQLLYTDTFVVVSVVFGAQLLWVQIRRAVADDPLPVSGAQPFATVYSIAIVAAWLGFLAFFGSRDSRVLGTGWAEYRRVLQASAATFGTLAIVVYLFNLQLARGYFLIALPAGVVGLVLVRRAWRQWLCAQRKDGEYSSKVVLVGSPASVALTARELNRTPQAGYRVLGAIVPPGDEDSALLGPDLPLVGGFDRIPDAMETNGADTVVITSSDALPPQRIRELGWRLEPGRQHLIVAPGLTDIGGPRIHTRPVAGLPLIHVETPHFSGGKTNSKRIFDVVVSFTMLLFALPLLAVAAAAIKLTSAGPVLFTQERVGKDGRPFRMLKFRTMVVDAEDLLGSLESGADAGNHVLFKMKDDPRVTGVGRFLRRHSLDELPQLINVLVGEMSLIGPRPPLECEVEEYDRHMRRRFLVKPGMTGLWQVSGRSDLSWDESVRLDLYYVENWTLTGDIGILARTARTVLKGDGAY